MFISKLPIQKQPVFYSQSAHMTRIPEESLIAFNKCLVVTQREHATYILTQTLAKTQDRCLLTDPHCEGADPQPRLCIHHTHEQNEKTI